MRVLVVPLGEMFHGEGSCVAAWNTGALHAAGQVLPPKPQPEEEAVSALSFFCPLNVYTHHMALADTRDEREKVCVGERERRPVRVLVVLLGQMFYVEGSCVAAWNMGALHAAGQVLESGPLVA